MKEKKLKYVIFDGISQNPTDEEVENGVGIFLGEKCDCMIAFGGGSVMDCAKGIGAELRDRRKQFGTYRDFSVCYVRFL